MIAIIDYNAGNIKSLSYALERLGCDSIIVTDNHDIIKNAEKVIIPGVGQAAYAMQQLKSKKLDTLITQLTQPVLGICLGMQLMCNYSEEGDVQGLGIFNATVKKFQPFDKVPHMGWNTLTNLKSELLVNIDENAWVYYVHSYYAEICEDTIAVTTYINEFSAALKHKNFYGCQFHPEKSSTVGEQILKNFLNL